MSVKASVCSKRPADDVEEEDPPDGGWGWVITVAAFIVFFLGTIPTVNFGVIFSQFLLDEGSSSTLTSLIFSVANINSGMACYLVEPLLEEFGWRATGMVSGGLFALGMIMSAFATSPTFLFFSFSIVVGCNFDLLITLSYVIIPHYFSHKKTMAIAIMSSGISFNQIVMPPFITYLQEEYGFRGTTLIIGAIFLNSCAAAMVFHPVHWHSKRPYSRCITQDHDQESYTHSTTLEQIKQSCSYNSPEQIKLYAQIPKPKHKKYSTYITKLEHHKPHSQYSTLDPGHSKEAKSMTKLLERLKRILLKTVKNALLLKTPGAASLIITISISGAIYLIVFACVPVSMNQEGFTWQDSSFCLSVSGICNLASRLLTGLFSCCPGIRLRPFFLFAIVLTGVGCIGLSVVGSLLGKAVMLGVCGVGAGLVASLHSLVVVEDLGLPYLYPALSLSYLISGLIFIIFGSITGGLADLTGNYTASFCVCGSILFLAAILGLLPPSLLPLNLPPPPPPEDQDHHVEEDIRHERRGEYQSL